MFVRKSPSEEDLHEVAGCSRTVAEHDGDGSVYSYEKFMEKGSGVDSSDRWRIVLLERECGLPESEYLYGKHMYSLGKTNEALEYFKRSAEGKGRHAEAKFAVLVKDFGYRVSALEVKSYFEDASRDGILEAQYNSGLGLLSEGMV